MVAAAAGASAAMVVVESSEPTMWRRRRGLWRLQRQRHDAVSHFAAALFCIDGLCIHRYLMLVAAVENFFLFFLAACSSSALLPGFVLSDLLGVFMSLIIAWSLAPVNCEFMRGVRIKGIFKLASCLQNAWLCLLFQNPCQGAAQI